jgi:hypothetical protein
MTETRNDSRGFVDETRNARRAALWLELGMTGGLLVAGTELDRRATLWLELGMTGGLPFGWN